MEKLSMQVIQALTILLPGFVALGVIRSLFSGERESDTDKISRSLVYSFVIYVAFVSIKGLSGQGGWSLDLQNAFPTRIFDILILFGLSILLGIGVSAYKHHDLHKLLRRLCITDRSCRTTVWNDVFIDKRRSYICIEFKDGRRLYGWPEYYSDDPKSPYLFLTDAEWITYDRRKEIRIPVPGYGIMICPTEEISFIQFTGIVKDDKS